MLILYFRSVRRRKEADNLTGASNRFQTLCVDVLLGLWPSCNLVNRVRRFEAWDYDEPGWLLSAVGLFIAVAEPSSAGLDHRRGDCERPWRTSSWTWRGWPWMLVNSSTGPCRYSKHRKCTGYETRGWNKRRRLNLCVVACHWIVICVPIMAWTLQSGRLIVVIVHRGDSRPGGQDVAGPRPGGAPDPGRRNQDLDGQDYLPDWGFIATQHRSDRQRNIWILFSLHFLLCCC